MASNNNSGFKTNENRQDFQNGGVRKSEKPLSQRDIC